MDVSRINLFPQLYAKLTPHPGLPHLHPRNIRLPSPPIPPTAPHAQTHRLPPSDRSPPHHRSRDIPLPKPGSSPPHTLRLSRATLRPHSSRRRPSSRNKTFRRWEVRGPICLPDVGHNRNLPHFDGFLPLYTNHMGFLFRVWEWAGDISGAGLFRLMGGYVWFWQREDE